MPSYMSSIMFLYVLSGDALWTEISGFSADVKYPLTVTLNDGRILVVNSASQNSFTLNSTRSWNNHQTGSVRNGGSLVKLQNGLVLYSGGRDVSNNFLNTTEVFNPLANAWTPAAEMNTARYSHTSTLMGDGNVLVCGGVTVQDIILDACEVYNPIMNTFSAGASMPIPRTAHHAIGLPSGDVLIEGGGGESIASLVLYIDAYIYKFQLDRFEHTGNMTNGRSLHSSTWISASLYPPLGGVLVAGGLVDSDSLSSVEVWNCSSEIWTAINPLNNARSRHTAEWVTPNRLLISGGPVGISASRSVEAYDFSLGSWLQQDNMVRARKYHASAKLTTGEVIVMGGPDAPKSVELYTVPTSPPSMAPFQVPSISPTRGPTQSLSRSPTRAPSSSPSKSPTHTLSSSPSSSPLLSSSPSRSPTQAVSSSPTMLTHSPTLGPTYSRVPSSSPSVGPTSAPTRFPTRTPTAFPTRAPSINASSGVSCPDSAILRASVVCPPQDVSSSGYCNKECSAAVRELINAFVAQNATETTALYCLSSFNGTKPNAPAVLMYRVNFNGDPWCNVSVVVNPVNGGSTLSSSLLVLLSLFSAL